ncbi:MAG: Na+/H+ antiporter subunit E [Candidimonas sp.]|nr:MAG: Na+/H+ antiporter subunit E [Candidimonas sp.]
MKRYLRRAAMPLCLLAIWLLLEEPVTPADIALGTALSIVLTTAAAPLRTPHAFPRRPLSMLRLLGIVALDVVKSNLIVARFVWAGPRTRPRPGFVRIALALRDPNALAVLACIITYTPGTVWVGVSDDYTLTLHVLDLHDEASWVRTIRQRYERPLKEIFE